MMQVAFKLSEIAHALKGTLHGPDADFTGVNTDTRTLAPGQLFIALKGERFDAHNFSGKAVEKGAVALMVENLQPLSIPQLLVADTRKALGQLSAYNRSFFTGPLLAITGSSGKTTVKEMLSAVLSTHSEVLATRGNLNNEIGVPLTLLNLSPEHRFAVIEMGASGAGEVAYCANLAKPDVALVNNAMAAHLEGFGSLKGVVQAKGEIYQSLGQQGVAVINLDDAGAATWQQLAGHCRCISFSLKNPQADLYASNLTVNRDGCYGFDLHYAGAPASVQLAVMGQHNVANALAAAAMAIAAGSEITQVTQALSHFTPVGGRLFVIPGLQGSRLIDDSYNANPGSVKAAISTLMALAGTRVLALGEMAELGIQEQELHADVGRFTAEQGVDLLLTLGTLGKYAADACQQAGGNARHFDNQTDLIEHLKQQLHPEMNVLVKGSRSAGMDKVVTALKQEMQACC